MRLGPVLGLLLNLDTLSTVVTAGSVPVLTSDSVGYSHHKGVATVRYDNGGFFGQVQINYIGKARVDPNTMVPMKGGGTRPVADVLGHPAIAGPLATVH